MTCRNFDSIETEIGKCADLVNYQYMRYVVTYELNEKHITFLQFMELNIIIEKEIEKL